MAKARSTVRRHLKALRQIIETTDDPVEMRIAYAMETAVRWATETTVGWSGLAEEAQCEAALLRKEMGS